MSTAGSAAQLPPEERDETAGRSSDAPGAPDSGLSVFIKVIGYFFLLPAALMLALRYWVG